MSGFIGFLVGVFTLALTYLFGKKSGKTETTTRLQADISVSRQEAKKAEAEKNIMEQTAKIVSASSSPEVKVDYSAISKQVEVARATDNENAAISAAQILAEQVTRRLGQ